MEENKELDLIEDVEDFEELDDLMKEELSNGLGDDEDE